MLTSSNICFVLPHILCILTLICQAFLGPLGERTISVQQLTQWSFSVSGGCGTKATTRVFMCSHALIAHPCWGCWSSTLRTSFDISHHLLPHPDWDHLISGALSQAPALPLSVLLFPRPRAWKNRKNLLTSKNLKWQQDGVVTLLLQVFFRFSVLLKDSHCLQLKSTYHCTSLGVTITKVGKPAVYHS